MGLLGTAHTLIYATWPRPRPETVNELGMLNEQHTVAANMDCHATRIE
jgi:hypothetical protein